MRCLRYRKGPAVPERDTQKMDGRKIALWHALWTHVMNFSAPCPVVKQKHDAGNTVFNSYLKIRSNDDRDFIPKMTFLRTFEIFYELGMCGKMPKSQNLELNT